MKKEICLNSIRERIELYNVKYPNSYNYIILKLCFWLVKQIFKKETVKKSNNQKYKVAFLLSGGVGDIICSMPYISKFYSNFYLDNDIDIFVHETREIIEGLFLHKKDYKKLDIFNSFSPESYDLVILLIRFPKVLRFKKSHDIELNAYIDYLKKVYKDNPIMFESGTQGDAIANAYSLLEGNVRSSQADLGQKLKVKSSDFTIDVVDDVTEVLSKFSLLNKQYITIQRGVGEADLTKEKSTRLWEKSKYDETCKLLKSQYPDIKIVQLGVSENYAIKNIDLDLRGKTSFEELKVLLKFSKLHISTEGGMVHLRHFLKGGKSVVLFGPTSKEFYGYPENINLSASLCANCEWVSNQWREKCIKTGSYAECMRLLTPEKILQSIIDQGVLSNVR
jgi:hypothetical protein